MPSPTTIATATATTAATAAAAAALILLLLLPVLLLLLLLLQQRPLPRYCRCRYCCCHWSLIFAQEGTTLHQEQALLQGFVRGTLSDLDSHGAALVSTSIIQERSFRFLYFAFQGQLTRPMPGQCSSLQSVRPPEGQT